MVEVGVCDAVVSLWEAIRLFGWAWGVVFLCAYSQKWIDFGRHSRDEDNVKMPET
jgi:hypothetical protein